MSKFPGVPSAECLRRRHDECPRQTPDGSVICPCHCHGPPDPALTAAHEANAPLEPRARASKVAGLLWGLAWLSLLLLVVAGVVDASVVSKVDAGAQFSAFISKAVPGLVSFGLFSAAAAG